MAPPIVLGRAGGVAGAGALLPDISSTGVREAIGRGAWEDVEARVPRAVLAHIRARGLYGAAT
jgi:nicotinic acid mononucleotide adenylyltransferase